MLVRLKNLKDGSDKEAELVDDVTATDFQVCQATWKPILDAAVNGLRLADKPIPHYLHWNWSTKARFLDRLDIKFLGVRCDGHIQGLLKADLGGMSRCKIEDQKGKELVYIDYVQAAPWNIPDFMEVLGYKALYSRTGTRLMQAAVQLSIDNELKGRIGLHSLRDAESFYRRIGMTPLERDTDKQNLLWFEFTPEAAQSFMENAS